jgi:hypothetical protein
MVAIFLRGDFALHPIIYYFQDRIAVAAKIDMPGQTAGCILDHPDPLDFLRTMVAFYLQHELFNRFIRFHGFPGFLSFNLSIRAPG